MAAFSALFYSQHNGTLCIRRLFDLASPSLSLFLPSFSSLLQSYTQNANEATRLRGRAGGRADMLLAGYVFEEDAHYLYNKFEIRPGVGQYIICTLESYLA